MQGKEPVGKDAKMTKTETVQVDGAGTDTVSVFVTNGPLNAGVTYTKQAVFQVGSLRSSRIRGQHLGSPESHTIKFSHGEGRSHDGYRSFRSVRQARACVGLAI